MRGQVLCDRNRYGHIKDGDQILIPGGVLYEIYKILKREVGEERFLLQFNLNIQRSQRLR